MRGVLCGFIVAPLCASLIVSDASGGCGAPDDVARRVAQPRKRVNIREAATCGDSLWEPLERETHGFARMDSVATDAVVTLLRESRTRASEALVLRLRQGQDPQAWLVAVASRPGERLGEGDVGRIIRMISGNFSEVERRSLIVGWNKQTVVDEAKEVICRRLAMDAAGQRGLTSALPALARLVEDDEAFAFHDDAARALGRLGDQRGVAPLEAALGRPGFEAPIAALQALWALGDRTRSLDLARSRLRQSEHPEGLRQEIERLSRQR